jgi:hypothetical protein
VETWFTAEFDEILNEYWNAGQKITQISRV